MREFSNILETIVGSKTQKEIVMELLSLRLSKRFFKDMCHLFILELDETILVH